MSLISEIHHLDYKIQHYNIRDQYNKSYHNAKVQEIHL